MQLYNAVPRQTSTDLELDRVRSGQTPTELDAQAHGVRLDRLDRNSTGSTGKGLDSASTAAPGTARRDSQGRQIYRASV